MNPINGTQQPQQQQAGMPVEQPFNDWHNEVYNNLRDTLQKYSAAGVPGMDQVVNSLNKTHMGLMKQYMPSQTQPEGQGGSGPQVVRSNQPQRPSTQQPTGGQVPFGQLNQLMQGIIQKNAPQMAQSPFLQNYER